MEQLTNDLEEMISRMRQQDREFLHEQEQLAINMIEEENRRQNMYSSDETLQLLRECMTGDVDAINRMSHAINADLQEFEVRFQHLNDMIEHVGHLTDEAEQLIGTLRDMNHRRRRVPVTDDEVIVIDDSDDDDDNDGGAAAAADDDGGGGGGSGGVGDIDVVVDVDEAANEDEDWDEFSLSDHSLESGYHGSVSDISDVTFYSSYSDELVHNEVCHFGYLVRPEHVRVPVCLQMEELPVTPARVPQGMSQSDIHTWLQGTETAMVRGQKRKREDSDDEADDDISQHVNETKRRKLHKAVRQSKSESSVYVQNGRDGVMRSFSEEFLCV